jgi:uncharacterized protein (DUF427 family)
MGHRGRVRPSRVEPGPGQESVWDYPRPPRVEAVARRVRIVFAGVTVVDTDRAMRVLETSHPPAYYVPFSALCDAELRRSSRTTVCEFKGRAAYWTLVAGGLAAPEAAWSYPRPAPGYEALADRFTVYPQRVDGCYLDGERVLPQPGGVYGGWITGDVVGPFKGGPDTWGW